MDSRFRTSRVSLKNGFPNHGIASENGIFGRGRGFRRYTPINWELLITNLLELVQNSMKVFFNLASKTSTNLDRTEAKFPMVLQPPRRNSAFGAKIIGMISSFSLSFSLFFVGLNNFLIPEFGSYGVTKSTEIKFSR